MKKKLAIYGAGGFGRETVVMIDQINQQKPTWEVIGFFDDQLRARSSVDGLPILGNIGTLNAHSEALDVCLAIADPRLRQQIFENITNKKIEFPVLIHPQANRGSEQHNKLGKGSIITAGAILTTGIELGDFSIINLLNSIGHDVKLGAFCTVMPSCSISGNVSIGSRSILGTGSRILQGKSIGADCLIGAGAVVTKNFPDNSKIVGMPARRIGKHVEGI